MNYLLDTSVLLWLMADPKQIPAPVLRNLENPSHILYFSSISVWEIYQKFALGKLQLSREPFALIQDACQDYAVQLLPFHATDAVHLPRLPQHHKDPFDRMLICQAIQNNLTLVTADAEIRQYPIATLWMSK